MNRSEKAAEIESLRERFASARLTILADYKGLSVASLTELRSQLRESSSTLKVIKNRLAKIAVEGSTAESLKDHFVGTTAVCTSTDDPVGPAKVLVEFAKKNEQLKIKLGLLKEKPLDLSEIKALAELPSKEELLAKLVGSMNAPATNLANVLSQIPRQLVNVLSAIKDQKEQNA